MRIEELIPEPAPIEWSTSALVFVDPVLMYSKDIRPGQKGCLEIREKNYPVRLGIPRKGSKGPRSIQIDFNIWNLFGGGIPSSITLVVEPDRLMEAAMVAVDIDRKKSSVDRESFEKILRFKAFPVKENYHLSIGMRDEQIFFRVLDTWPAGGGTIGWLTRILLGETELEGFKKVYQVRSIFEDTLKRIRRTETEIRVLLDLQNRYREQIGRLGNPLAALENLVQQNRKMEERIAHLGELLRDLEGEYTSLGERLEGMRAS